MSIAQIGTTSEIRSKIKKSFMENAYLNVVSAKCQYFFQASFVSKAITENIYTDFFVIHQAALL